MGREAPAVAMSPTDQDIVVAWVGRAWVVSLGGEVLSRFGYRSPALAAAKDAARRRAADGESCRVIVLEKSGEFTVPKRRG